MLFRKLKHDITITDAYWNRIVIPEGQVVRVINNNNFQLEVEVHVGGSKFTLCHIDYMATQLLKGDERALAKVLFGP